MSYSTTTKQDTKQDVVSINVIMNNAQEPDGSEQELKECTMKGLQCSRRHKGKRNTYKKLVNRRKNM